LKYEVTFAVAESASEQEETRMTMAAHG
jgi:hypothetical protein